MNLMTKTKFMEKMKKLGREDVILIGDYINTKTPTTFKCLNDDCGFEWTSTPNRVITGQGCPYCHNKRIRPDKRNSAGAKRPDLLKFFVNPEDAFNIAPYSHKIVTLKCPDCENIKTSKMDTLTVLGFKCHYCIKSSISYPNRLIRSIFQQLSNEVDFLEYEWRDTWTERQRYDVYFEKDGNKYCIELQGEQHYKRGWHDKRSLEEIQEKDLFKSNMALEHGITPIVIDARKSNFQYIFSNIKESILGNLFDLEKIDTNRCQDEITSNIIKRVCDYFSNCENKSTTAISKYFGISSNTIVKYLKVGTELGWCDYSPQNKVKVLAYNVDISFAQIYPSIAECQRDLEERFSTMTFNNITRACKEGYFIQGFKFIYV